MSTAISKAVPGFSLHLWPSLQLLWRKFHKCGRDAPYNFSCYCVRTNGHRLFSIRVTALPSSFRPAEVTSTVMFAVADWCFPLSPLKLVLNIWSLIHFRENNLMFLTFLNCLQRFSIQKSIVSVMSNVFLKSLQNLLLVLVEQKDFCF